MLDTVLKVHESRTFTKYQKIGRTSSLTRKTFAGRLHGRDLETLDSSINPRFYKRKFFININYNIGNSDTGHQIEYHH